jgi:hypothetical protein
MVSRPAVLQFGLRGTEGVLTAARNGAASVTVVEPAEEFVEMVRSDLSGFSGGLPASVPVEILPSGARNFLARRGGRFDLIEVPEISSATFSSLGIHAAGETFLLTREGIRSALSRLTDRGVLAFSGWLKSPPRESVKILATPAGSWKGSIRVPHATGHHGPGWGSRHTRQGGFRSPARKETAERFRVRGIDRGCREITASEGEAEERAAAAVGTLPVLPADGEKLFDLLRRPTILPISPLPAAVLLPVYGSS